MWPRHWGPNVLRRDFTLQASFFMAAFLGEAISPFPSPLPLLTPPTTLQQPSVSRSSLVDAQQGKDRGLRSK